MNIKSSPPRWYRGRRTALEAALLMALGAASVTTLADQPAPTAAVSRVADVSLADLNLSTPEGMSAARARLHAMAERVCAQHTSGSRRTSRAAWTARWRAPSGRSMRSIRSN